MNSGAKILAIDDDPQILGIIKSALSRPDMEILTEEDPEKGFQTFLEARPMIVLLDVFMPQVSGLDILSRILNVDPGVDVILITAHYSTDSAVESIKRGACDYLTKPLRLDKLRSRIDGLLSESRTRQQTLRLDLDLLNTYQFEGIVGRSPIMLEVYAKIRRIAPHYTTVLITGPTGTGKELVARALHRRNPVANGPFVICDCSALVDTLVESELFGYVRGAFTGANQDKKGLFEHADHGTVFLDEVGELTPSAQAKLLRVLQNRQVQRVGSTKALDVDFRVIAATHRDLQRMVRDGLFREDLYYRLAVVEIALPRLASRREDLPLLERYFVEKFSTEYNKSISGLTRRAQSLLSAYDWPGNVRELEHVIGSGCMMATGNVIDIHDLPERLRVFVAPASGDDIFLSVDEVQQRHIVRVLDAVGGNKLRAAQILGIGRNTIYKVLSQRKLHKRKTK